MQRGAGKSGHSPLTELSIVKSPHGGQSNPVFRVGEKLRLRLQRLIF
jgi:hypothetical protein